MFHASVSAFETARFTMIDIGAPETGKAAIIDGCIPLQMPIVSVSGFPGGNTAVKFHLVFDCAVGADIGTDPLPVQQEKQCRERAEDSVGSKVCRQVAQMGMGSMQDGQ